MPTNWQDQTCPPPWTVGAGLVAFPGTYAKPWGSSPYAVDVPVFLIYAIYALAVARATRLVAEDKILERPRIWALARLPEDSLIGYLLTCRWCVSVWLSLPAAAVAVLWGSKPWFLIPATALAFSHITGLLVRAEEN